MLFRRPAADHPRPGSIWPRDMMHTVKSEKHCFSCSRTLPIASFAIRHQKGRPARPNYRCKQCESSYLQQWKRDNSERNKAHNRKSYARTGCTVVQREYAWKRLLAKAYGLTPERYAEMLLSQNGRCAICKQESDKKLVVDHDHKTGAVRGLLCVRCNLGLGYIEKSSEPQAVLVRMAEYVKGT